jgi:hypothetical protein
LAGIGLMLTVIVGCSGGTMAPPTSSAGHTSSNSPQVLTPRPSPTLGPHGEWTFGGLLWRPLDTPVLTGLFVMPNGLVGICQAPDGSPADACTSSDGGLTWESPADPSIFIETDMTPFRAQVAVLGANGWVATDFGYGLWDRPIAGNPRSGEGLLAHFAAHAQTKSEAKYASIWRSKDGLHWSRSQDSPILKDKAPNGLFSIDGAYYLDVMTDDWVEQVFMSNDGATWAAAPDSTILPIACDANGKGCLGAGPDHAGYYGNPTTVVFSPSGSDWQSIVTPSPIESMDLMSLAALPDGSYVAGTYSVSDGGIHLVRSTDGVNWTDPVVPPEAISVVVEFGGRLIASMPDSLVSDAIWVSGDGGRSWQVVTRPDGSLVQGTDLVVDGSRLLIESSDGQSRSDEFTIVAVIVAA